jgi:hypothetical protein
MIRITCPDANCIVNLYIKEDKYCHNGMLSTEFSLELSICKQQILSQNDLNDSCSPQVNLYIKEDIADRATIKIVSSSRSVNTFIHKKRKIGEDIV